MTARRTLLIGSVLASTVLSSCTHDGTSTPTPKIGATVPPGEVSSAGGTASAGSFRVDVPPGAIKSKTRLIMKPSTVRLSPKASLIVKRLSDEVNVSLRGGVEPVAPVTVSARPTNSAAITAARSNRVMLLSRDGRTNAWNLTPAHYDSTDKRLIATINHFSILQFVRVDVAAPLEGALKIFKSAFGLEGTTKPDCAGKPLTISGTTYSLDARYLNAGDGIVWPCLASGADNAIELKLANATGLPWLIRSRPRAAVTDPGTVDINQAVLLALYDQFLSGGRFSQSMVLPGATKTYAFDGAKLPGLVDMELDGFAQQAMALIWALRFALDLFYPTAAVGEALSRADFGSCVTDLVATATGTFDAGTVGTFIKAFFSCAGNVVEALGGSLFGVAKVIVAAMSGGISLILNDLIAAYRTVAGKDHTRVTVDVQVQPATQVIDLAPVDQSGQPTTGWTVDSTSLNSGPLGCAQYGTAYPSPAAVTRDIYFCGTTADSTNACWLSSTPSQVLCLRDPFTRKLSLRALAADDHPGPVAPEAHPQPIGLQLSDGTKCEIRTGGAVDRSTEHPTWAFTYYCDKSEAVWAPPSSTSGIDNTNQTWTVWTGKATQPLHKVAVATAYYVTTAN